MLVQTAIRHTGTDTASKMPHLKSDDSGTLNEALQLMGAIISYPRGGEIFGEEEAADYLYQVVSGSVRTYKVLNDGRRQIGGFYLPSDIFGLEFGDEHAFSAEAMTDTKVRVIKRRALHDLAERNPSIARELILHTGVELRQMQKRMLLLIMSAQERVASFLLEVAERAPAQPAIDLAMSRQDIADYLGMTIETVSRTLTALEASAAIELQGSRHIVLRNRNTLNRLNG
jgi:CRP-like cAMP-binding protein